nr:hypothetical protein [Tanacetum cinerariifolium]
MKLHSLLKTSKQGIKKIDVPYTLAAPVLTVSHNAKKRKTSNSNWKGKAAKGKYDRGSKRKVEYEIAPTSNPKETVCLYCNTKGHWKCSCPKYPKDLKDKKVKKGSHSGSCERGEGLLDIVHTDMCGPFQSATKDGKCYYVTFTDDFSRYGYVYLIKHKSDTFKVFKGERPSFRHIKIWGCEVLVRREVYDKLEARSENCLIVSYPEESFGYLFYKPKDNVVSVARRGVFLNREMISKEESGSKINLEEIQDSINEKPIVNTDTQQEVVTPVKPDDISLPIRKTSGRVIKPPKFYYGFYIEEDKIIDSTLSELDEPANYKEAMTSLEAAKWKEAMKNEIQSMYDNQDLCLKSNEELDRCIRVPYALAVGSIMYAMTCTSPDVSFALSMGAVTWKSLKQDTVADSTCESEYIAACEASKKLSG